VSKEIKNLPHSVHTRLSRIAKENSKTFEQVFYLYALERFLYRLTKSEHAPSFVLKGALMFFGWDLPLRRLTKDIDLQGYTANDLENLTQIIRQICIQPVEPDDGMEFDPESVVGEIIMEETNYEGVRLRFIGYLGKAKRNLQVDFSFANVITPAAEEITYPTLLPELGMQPFPIRGYPVETSISEKFQTMVDKGEINSRMKDFYDIWEMIQQCEIKGTTLVKAITNTFNARNTTIPGELPVALTSEFVEQKSSEWAGFYRKLPPPPIIHSDFQLVIDDLSTFLSPPMIVASKGGKFDSIWYPKKGWD
jgi:hypothetical protein